MPMGLSTSILWIFVSAGSNGSKRRPAWDYKGRLEDMEEYVRSVNQKLLTTNDRLEMVESNNSQLEGNVVVKEREKEQVIFLKQFYRDGKSWLISGTAD